MATIETQTFGLEFEFYGLNRTQAKNVIAKYFDTENRVGTNYALDRQNRKWQVVYDGSIRAPRGEACEMVTPILKYEDIADLQEIIRCLREAGAGVNETCGIHIHIGADQHDAKSIRNLVNIFYSKQDMIYKSLDIKPFRAERYTKKLKDSFIQEINKEKPKNLQLLGKIWYGSDVIFNQTKYNNSRYHGLNLHNLWYGQTVEFRLFNSTTHAGKIKAYIQFCLAVSALAINSRSASAKKTISDNEKYTFRTWLLRLGLIGDEYKTCRTHMLANLEGNSAWRQAQ
jgi:Putative amidoligase enzyme